jgi:hypothetical protein
MSLDFKAFYRIAELPPVELRREAGGFWAEHFARLEGEKESAPTSTTGGSAV